MQVQEVNQVKEMESHVQKMKYSAPSSVEMEPGKHTNFCHTNLSPISPIQISHTNLAPIQSPTQISHTDFAHTD